MTKWDYTHRYQFRTFSYQKTAVSIVDLGVFNTHDLFRYFTRSRLDIVKASDICYQIFSSWHMPNSQLLQGMLLASIDTIE